MKTFKAVVATLKLKWLRTIFELIAQRISQVVRRRLRDQVTSFMCRLVSYQIDDRYSSRNLGMEDLWVTATVFGDLKVSFPLKLDRTGRRRDLPMDFDRAAFTIRLFARLMDELTRLVFFYSHLVLGKDLQVK